jgi:hypothetical protein
LSDLDLIDLRLDHLDLRHDLLDLRHDLLDLGHDLLDLRRGGHLDLRGLRDGHGLLCLDCLGSDLDGRLSCLLCIHYSAFLGCDDAFEVDVVAVVGG